MITILTSMWLKPTPKVVSREPNKNSLEISISYINQEKLTMTLKQNQENNVSISNDIKKLEKKPDRSEDVKKALERPTAI